MPSLSLSITDSALTLAIHDGPTLVATATLPPADLSRLFAGTLPSVPATLHSDPAAR